MGTDPQPPRRAYRSPLRERQAQATRARILAAAAMLFVDEGYAATTMRAVARAAETSERTVYVAFASKAHLLAAAIRAAVRGGDEETPLLRQAPWRDLDGPPATEVAAQLAAGAAGLWERTAALIQVAEAAASTDPELARLRDAGHRATAEDMHEVARALAARGLLPAEVETAYVGDALFALLGSPDVYLRLVGREGRGPDDYVDVMRRAVSALLLEEAPGAGSSVPGASSAPSA